MNTLSKSLLIGLTALGMGSATLSAYAQDGAAPAAPAAHHRDPAAMQAKMADMMAKRQAKLHDLLKLTAQQESAWATYQAAIKPAATGAGEHASFATLSAPDRLSKMIEMSKQHEAKLEATLPALTAFYGQLSAEQKAIFDDHTMGGKHGGFHGHRGGWGGHRG